MGGIIYLSQTAWLKYLGQLQFSRFFFLLFLVFISCPGKAMVLSSLISVFSIKKGANLHYIEKYRGTGGSGIPECWQLWVQCGGATFLSCPASSTWQRNGSNNSWRRFCYTDRVIWQNGRFLCSLYDIKLTCWSKLFGVFFFHPHMHWSKTHRHFVCEYAAPLDHCCNALFLMLLFKKSAYLEWMLFKGFLRKDA